MFGLLSHFTRAFNGSSLPATHSISWELPLAPELSWSKEETEAIRQNAAQRNICSVIDPSKGSVMQTVILRFDKSNHKLLLDEFFPRPSFTPMGGRFHLNIPTHDGHLALKIVIRSQLDVANAPAYLTEVVEKTRLRGQPKTKGVSFKETTAPRVELLLPFAPMMGGQLLELSEEEFSMAFCGNNRPPLYSRKGECRIHFSNFFVLQTKVEVLQAQVRRRPFHHTHLRIGFQTLNPFEKEQLSSFLHNFTEAQTA